MPVACSPVYDNLTNLLCTNNNTTHLSTVNTLQVGSFDIPRYNTPSGSNALTDGDFTLTASIRDNSGNSSVLRGMYGYDPIYHIDKTPAKVSKIEYDPYAACDVVDENDNTGGTIHNTIHTTLDDNDYRTICDEDIFVNVELTDLGSAPKAVAYDFVDDQGQLSPVYAPGDTGHSTNLAPTCSVANAMKGACGGVTREAVMDDEDIVGYKYFTEIYVPKNAKGYLKLIPIDNVKNVGDDYYSSGIIISSSKTVSGAIIQDDIIANPSYNTTTYRYANPDYNPESAIPADRNPYETTPIDIFSDYPEFHFTAADAYSGIKEITWKKTYNFREANPEEETQTYSFEGDTDEYGVRTFENCLYGEALQLDESDDNLFSEVPKANITCDQNLVINFKSNTVQVPNYKNKILLELDITSWNGKIDHIEYAFAVDNLKPHLDAPSVNNTAIDDDDADHPLTITTFNTSQHDWYSTAAKPFVPGDPTTVYTPSVGEFPESGSGLYMSDGYNELEQPNGLADKSYMLWESDSSSKTGDAFRTEGILTPQQIRAILMRADAGEPGGASFNPDSNDNGGGYGLCEISYAVTDIYHTAPLPSETCTTELYNFNATGDETGERILKFSIVDMAGNIESYTKDLLVNVQPPNIDNVKITKTTSGDACNWVQALNTYFCNDAVNMQTNITQNKVNEQSDAFLSKFWLFYDEDGPANEDGQAAASLKCNYGKSVGLYEDGTELAYASDGRLIDISSKEIDPLNRVAHILPLFDEPVTQNSDECAETIKIVSKNAGTKITDDTSDRYSDTNTRTNGFGSPIASTNWTYEVILEDLPVLNGVAGYPFGSTLENTVFPVAFLHAQNPLKLFSDPYQMGPDINAPGADSPDDPNRIHIDIVPPVFEIGKDSDDAGFYPANKDDGYPTSTGDRLSKCSEIAGDIEKSTYPCYYKINGSYYFNTDVKIDAKISDNATLDSGILSINSYLNETSYSFASPAESIEDIVKERDAVFNTQGLAGVPDSEAGQTGVFRIHKTNSAQNSDMPDVSDYALNNTVATFKKAGTNNKFIVATKPPSPAQVSFLPISGLVHCTNDTINNYDNITAATTQGYTKICDGQGNIEIAANASGTGLYGIGYTFLDKNGTVDASIYNPCTIDKVIDEYKENRELVQGDCGYLDKQIVEGDDGQNIQKASTTVELPLNYKGFIKITVMDYVGHIVETYTSGIILESEQMAKSSTNISITLPTTPFRDNSGNQLYGDPIQIISDATSSHSGIKSAQCTKNGTGNVINPYDTISQIDKNIYNKASTGYLTISDNMDSIEIICTVRTNASLILGTHTFTARAIFSIDDTSPRVTMNLTGDTPERGNIYNKPITVNIQVRERYFDYNGFNLNVNGRNISGSALSWRHVNGQGDDSVYIASYKVSDNNHYRIVASMKDRVGHASNVYPLDFWIDSLAPEVSINFDNNNSRNGNYYDANRTVTFSVKEHFFDPATVQIICTANRLGVTVPCPSNTPWHSSGGAGIASGTYDTWTSSITFSDEAEYTIGIVITDTAGNMYENRSIDKFVIDKTAPTISISGIEPGNAYNGEIHPAIHVGDWTFDTLDIRLVGANRGMVTGLAGTGAMSETGGIRYLDDFPYERLWDDLYTLTVTGVDKAGNSYTTSVEFSINRFGSVYILDPTVKAELEARNTFITRPIDIKFSEINVNLLDTNAIEVDLIRDGIPRTLHQGEEYSIVDNTGGSGAGFGGAGTGGGKTVWARYDYTINAAVISDDAYYSIKVYSLDRAGNDNSTYTKPDASDYVGTSAGSGAGYNNGALNNIGNDIDDPAVVAFVVDKTNPLATLLNVNNNGIFNVESLNVKVAAEDNIALDTVAAFADNSPIDKIVIDPDTGLYTFDMLPSNNRQSVKVTSTDKAGNVFQSEATGIIISSNFWVRLFSNKYIMWGATAGLVALGGGILYLLSRMISAAAARRNAEDDEDDDYTPAERELRKKSAALDRIRSART
ncbi:MAG: hypothetical protein LBN03_02730 [Bifidobacteriaceae bacterium]|jgi:hypothetical protein|nr:hypothetical protein [Bifidobacteriaceae bacterium]